MKSIAFLGAWIAFIAAIYVGNRSFAESKEGQADKESVVVGTSAITLVMGGLIALIVAKETDKYFWLIALVLAVSGLIAAVRALVRYRGEIREWFRVRQEKFRKWRDLKRSINEVRKIYRESKVPPKTNAKLGAAIAEWDESKRKLPLLAVSLTNLEAELVRMGKALEKARAGAQKKSLDPDVADSYAAMAGDLEEQAKRLSSLITEVKSEISMRKERLAMIAEFFKDIPEQAKVYEDYDTFSAEAMDLQKNLKDELAKVPK